MKTLKYITVLIFVGSLLFNSCNTDELKELNVNPTAANEIDLGYMFAYAQIQTSGERYENWRAVLIYQSTMIQHLSALATYWSGDKYLYNSSYSASLWERAYRNYIKDLVQIIELSKDDPELINLNAAARIWKVFAMHRLTDHYGDVPYSEAGKGYIDGNFNPKYDAQSAIYADMLKELEEATAAFDNSKTTYGDQDLIYKGSIDKWKKFGYSMMLRLGMRLSKVDPSAAESWVAKAVAGGVMESNTDNCFIRHSDGPEGINKNGIGEVFQVDDNGLLSKTFVDWLKARSDPRLKIYSGGRAIKDGDGNITGWNINYDDQVGMPNGYDASTIKDYEGVDDVDRAVYYSRVNPLIVDVASPMVFMTYAEVEFLKAEAALRTWITGDPEEFYEKGIEASMKMWTIYDESLDISEGEINNYIANNAFDSNDGLRLINEQFWASVFLNEYEAYSNWRRSGYPQLTPTNYPGNKTNGQIPRRLIYPVSEVSLNTANYNEAISRQGPDEFMTRIWWDVNN